jgi:hypothetical protein
VHQSINVLQTDIKINVIGTSQSVRLQDFPTTVDYIIKIKIYKTVILSVVLYEGKICISHNRNNAD